MTEFTVDENNSYYTAVDGLLVGQSGRKLIAVPAGREGSLIVPEGIEVIGFGAFEDSKLSEIQFLDNANILSFGYRAFYNAKNITEMHIPASVVAIDYYAFANCTALETVTFADGSGLNGVYEGAFYGCKNLSEIQLPDGIDEISDFAFYGCRKLTKLPVSETSGIKGIYSYAMAYSGLGGEFTTPATLYDIGDYAFLGTRVTEVIITDTNVKDLIIGIGAFEECNVLEEITLPFIGASFENPDITWFGYIFGAGAWEANSVYLPESLKKVTITEGITFVGEGAFYKISSIEEIELPHSITKLCHWAFFGCKSKHELTNEISIDDKVLRWGTFGEGISGHLTLAEGITEISDSVFYRCYGLVSITLPNGITRIDGFYESGLREIVITEGVTHIASNAFAHCASLISVTLPSTLVSIDTGAFDYCKSLYTIINNSNLNITFGTTDNGCIGQYAELIIDKYGNKHYKKVDTEYIDTTDGFRFVYQNGEYQLIAYLGKEATVRLPKDINGNNYSIKNPSGLRHVIIPGELIEINDQAFQRCQSLLSVTIEEGVKSIGEKAFSNCASLTTVILPDSVTDIGEWMFSDCSSLKCVLLSGSLKTIPVNAFIRCYSLENISIPPSVTKIDSQAFKECNSLVEVNLPEKLTTIGVGAFENCGLTKIKIPNSVKQINLGAFKGCDNLVLMFNDDNPNFQVKDGIVYNKDMTSFVYIPLWITSVEIPKTITDVSYTFANHPNLQTVTFEQGGKLTKIGSQAFEGCEKLVQITLPDNITTIGYAAFSRCISLKKIKIPTSVTMIEPSAFNSCEKLAKIDIPTNITTIYSSTFSYCRSLTDIILPENLKHIQLNAFWHSGVTNLSIPAGVQTIEERAFEGCDNLYFITNNSNLPLTPGSNDHGAIAAAAVCITDKNGNRIWRKDDATYIETEDQFLFKCKGGAYQLLAYLGNKETVTLPLDINGNPYSIYHMTGVKNVIIPYGITSIDEAAFYRCATLNSIEIPESVLSIGSNAFCQCTNLTEIVIPQSVRSIGNAAFSGSGLLSISLPQNITRIENSAFSDTDFYNDPDNWENGILYIDDYLICVSQNVEYFELKEGTKLVAGGAYYRCYKLKIAYVFGDIDFAYYDLTNLETLVVFELPRRISSYFEEVPLTLKNIILKKGITMNSSAFNAITNVCIWSEDNERDTLWDENYPNWNNGNRVVYGNSWIWANFYDDTREMKSKKIYTTTQIVRVPWLDDYQMGDYMYTFQGFDIDGDGAMDNVPATSQINVVGYAVYSKESICNWYGHEYNKWTETKRPTCTEVGEERHDCERCEHFETREVKALGHATVQHDAKDAACTGIGWYAYKTCSRCDYTTYVEIPAKGHSHNAVVMNPTCTERGYTIHACHCGDAYVDSYVDALDHKFGEWVETKAPTCTEVGEDRKDCEACDHFETREIPIVDHADDDANGTCDMCGKRMASEEEPSGGCLSVLTISSYSVLVMAAFSFLAVFKKKKD
ncbi:MAG: leucine-rich repeat domain-containing protein [Clostridia bacterium]|nr:leucine-rich repeat domain-containing protein [Clostridia bacterium]